MLRRIFLGLSTSTLTRQIITHFNPAKKLARRFIAGETLDEAVAVVKNLNRRGLKGLLNEVGESITNQTDVRNAVEDIKTLVHRINTEGLNSTISLKPSHVGLSFGRDFFYEMMVEIVKTARAVGIVVEIDMEGSPDGPATLEVYHRLLDAFGGGLRLAVQGYLHRTPADVQKLISRGAGIRLVKGAYSESAEIAYQEPDRINQAMIEIMEQMLDPLALEAGAYLALGSHDPVLIDWLLHETTVRNIDPRKFEFQMLQGVRRDEQERLAALGYQMRVYVPYGVAWYPYFMRRLAEKPANVFFMARAVAGK